MTQRSGRRDRARRFRARLRGIRPRAALRSCRPARTRPSASQVAPPRIAGSLLRLSLALAIGYGALAAGLGYWQVVEAQRLTNDPLNPLVLSASRAGAARHDLRPRRQRARAQRRRQRRAAARVSVPRGRAGRRLPQRHLRHGRAREHVRRAADRAWSRCVPATSCCASSATSRTTRPTSTRRSTSSSSRLATRPAGRPARRGRGHRAVHRPRPGPGQQPDVQPEPHRRPARTAARTWPTCASARTRRCSTAPRRACTCPARCSRSSPPSPAWGRARSAPSPRIEDQPEEYDTGFLVEGFRIRDFPRRVQLDHPLDFYEATEVSSNIWFAHAGLDTGADDMIAWAARLGFGQRIAVRAAHLAQPGQRRRRPAGRLPRPGRAGQRRLRPGRGARHAAPDGARRVDHRQRRPADEAQAGRRAARQRRHGHAARCRRRWSQVIDPVEAQVIGDAMQRAVEGRYGEDFAGAAKVPGVPTAGKSGTAQLGGDAAPHSLVHRLRAGRRATDRDRGHRRGRRRRRAARGADGRPADEQLPESRESTRRNRAQVARLIAY